MMLYKKLIYGVLLLFFSPGNQAQVIKSSITSQAHANDSTNLVHIRNITIKGNKKTKDYIILREAQLKPGDAIPLSALNNVLEHSRTNVYNTTLFNEFKIHAGFPDSLSA